MSVEDPQSPPKLTDYEKSLIEALRDERRRKLGIETVDVAAAQPTEQPGQDVAPAPEPLPPEEPDEDVQPAPVEPISTPVPAQEREVPLTARTPSPPPAIPRKRSRLPLIMLGSLLAIALAAAALAVLNSSRQTATSTSETPPAPPPPIAKLVPPDELKAPLKDVAADVEQLFASYPADRANGRAGFRRALADPALDSAERERYLEVSGNRIRLRRLPTESATVLRTLRRGAYVRLTERAAGNEWCAIQLPDGRAGFMKCTFLKPIAGPESDAGVQARNESRPSARQR